MKYLTLAQQATIFKDLRADTNSRILSILIPISGVACEERYRMGGDEKNKAKSEWRPVFEINSVQLFDINGDNRDGLCG